MRTTMTFPNGAAILALLVACAAAPAQPSGVAAGDASLAQVVKTFDFDERPLGNFERRPMYWERLDGPGLPSYSDAAFDDDQGHASPPSFHFDLLGGSIAYEYRGAGLEVTPFGEYRIRASIRTGGLELARAFVAAWVSDAAGRPLPGTHVITEAVGGDTDWRQVGARLTADHADAAQLHLQLWVLQRGVWDDALRAGPDPILRQDVGGAAWFDDIVIERTARLRLTIAPDGCVAAAGEPVSVQIDAHNPATTDADVELSIEPDGGAAEMIERRRLGALKSGGWTHADETLPTGSYQFIARLIRGQTVLLERTARFAVLPELPFAWRTGNDVGISIDAFEPRDASGLAALVYHQAVGVVRAPMPVEVDGAQVDPEDVRGVLLALARRGVRTVGMLSAPQAALERATTSRFDAYREWLAQADDVLSACGPYLAGLQPASDPDREIPWSEWTDERLETLRAVLSKRAPAPRLILPRNVLDAPPAAVLGASDEGAAPGASPHAVSWRLPEMLATADLSWQLAAFAAPGGSEGGRDPLESWLTIEASAPARTPDEIVDLTRRIALSRAFQFNRWLVPPQFEISASGGATRWTPTRGYIPVRTLLHALADSRVIAAVPLENDGIGLIFRRLDTVRLLAWSWQVQASAPTRVPTIGPAARAFDLWGAEAPLTKSDGYTTLPLGPAPLVVEDVDPTLMLLDRSVDVRPTLVQPHIPDAAPRLTFTNRGDGLLTGHVEIVSPPELNVGPPFGEFTLAAGATYERELRIALPNPVVVQSTTIEVKLHIDRPTPAVLTYRPTLSIGLEGIDLDGRCVWDGDDLLVEHGLRNRTDAPVSLEAQLQPRGFPPREATFSDIAPAQRRSYRHRLRDAVALAGGSLLVAHREIDGPREIHLRLAIPPREPSP